jgi:hypothetical protein
MKNHFHLVVETPEPNLVEGMRWLQSTFTIRLNHRHKLYGHVFSGRYKALLVDGSGDGYLKTVCDYVHLNPVRAGLLKSDDRLLSYPWSSLGWYGAKPELRPAWIRVDRLLGEHGIEKDVAAGRQKFLDGLEARRQAEGVDSPGVDLEQIRRGWCLGSPAFRQELLDQFGENKGENQTGEIRRESSEARARRIIAEELKALGWSAAKLKSEAKSHPSKLALGARLRRETILTTKEIAVLLCLGTTKSAVALLHRWMRNNPQKGNQDGKIKGNQSARTEVGGRTWST